MVLIFVRRDEGKMYRYLRETFAGCPVYITWDRRVEQRRQSGKHLLGDRRRHERRASRLNLERLPFVAVTGHTTGRLSA